MKTFAQEMICKNKKNIKFAVYFLITIYTIYTIHDEASSFS